MPRVRRLLKRAESLLQRELIRVASLPARRRRAHSDLRQPRHVLVLRNDWIGDMVMSTGCLRRIKEAHPEVEVDVVAGPSNAAVLDGLPFVRRVFVHSQGDVQNLFRLRRQLRTIGYDVALNGRVLRPKLTPDPALVLLASGAPRRIGVAGGGADFLYTDLVSAPTGQHFVRHVAALTEPLGLDPDAGDWRPSLYVAPAERDSAEREWAMVPGSGDRLLVNISVRHAERRWPDERFVEALRRLRAVAPDVRVLVASSPDDHKRAGAIAERVRGVAIEPGALRRMFALVAAADAVFTPDTGIAHVASAFATPIVVLLQQGNETFLPYRTPGRYVSSDGASLNSLPVDPVAAALKIVLSIRSRLEPACLPVLDHPSIPASTH